MVHELSLGIDAALLLGIGSLMPSVSRIERLFLLSLQSASSTGVLRAKELSTRAYLVLKSITTIRLAIIGLKDLNTYLG